MGYRNGKDVLPDFLLKRVQKYIQGELLYIPKEDNNRARWGELSGARESYQLRNQQIYKQYNNGIPLDELMTRYSLSEESIRKIVSG
ncbi:MAG TPA: CD3324 family protein [Halanaerobiales bacterium]|nr:CD3324 family protein [Halanaerobiales bacterium]